jgi:hypothetical protein
MILVKVLSPSMYSTISAYHRNKRLNILTPRFERRYLCLIRVIENIPYTRIIVCSFSTTSSTSSTPSTPSTSSTPSNSSNSSNSTNTSNPLPRVKEFDNLDQTANLKAAKKALSGLAGVYYIICNVTGPSRCILEVLLI